MKRMLVSCCLCVAAAAAHHLFSQTQEIGAAVTQPEELKAAIQNVHPDAEILELDDMDTSSCGPLEAHPGLVSADFDGNGRVDYAVLFKAGDVKEEKEWRGRKLSLMDLWLVAFLQQDDGLLASFVLAEFETFLPSDVMIEKQLPGTIEEWDSERIVTLRNPGFLFHFCGKSASVFYWSEGKFERIWISD
jgi:hypothetical protein